MIALIQRVSHAQVETDGRIAGRIGRGVLALVGIRRTDDRLCGERLLERILSYRIFPDAEDRMNLSVRDIQGGLLLVPQFTLAADTRKGTRAGFSTAAAPEVARELFTELVSRARAIHPASEAGIFGAHMRVSLLNDGPVTFWLETDPGPEGRSPEHRGSARRQA